MQLEFRYRFEAAHRFLKSDSIPCMTPHGHSWYATLGVSFIGDTLNSSQMTVEFSQIKKDWRKLIQGTFDHSYMHNINDPVVEVLGNSEHRPRLIPFPGDPTTEMIALFMFNKMNTLLEASKVSEKLEVQSITIEETPTNKIICHREDFFKQIQNFKTFSGWWSSQDTADRSFKHNA